MGGHLDVVEWLVNEGVDPNTQDEVQICLIFIEFIFDDRQDLPLFIFLLIVVIWMLLSS